MSLRVRLDTLLQRVAGREPGAWEEFWSIAGPRCWPTIKACAPRSEWEDLHAEIAADVWEHADGYRPGTYPLSWVHAVARYAAFKASKAHSEVQWRRAFVDMEALVQESDILGAMVRQAEARRALRGLKRVSAKHRLAALQYAAGASTKQVARSVGIAKGRNALWAVRQAMREEAGADFMPAPHEQGDPRPIWSSANPHHAFAERCAIGHHDAGRPQRDIESALRPLNDARWQA